MLKKYSGLFFACDIFDFWKEVPDKPAYLKIWLVPAHHESRRSRLQMLFKIGVLQISQISQENTCVGASF